jgi:hypothetical protein
VVPVRLHKLVHLKPINHSLVTLITDSPVLSTLEQSYPTWAQMLKCGVSVLNSPTPCLVLHYCQEPHPTEPEWGQSSKFIRVCITKKPTFINITGPSHIPYHSSHWLSFNFLLTQTIPVSLNVSSLTQRLTEKIKQSSTKSGEALSLSDLALIYSTSSHSNLTYITDCNLHFSKVSET